MDMYVSSCPMSPMHSQALRCPNENVPRKRDHFTLCPGAALGLRIGRLVLESLRARKAAGAVTAKGASNLCLVRCSVTNSSTGRSIRLICCKTAASTT